MGEAIYVRGRGYLGNSVLSAQYCYELKPALKNKVYLKINQVYF